MSLPSRANVETLDYSIGGGPAAFLEAKSLTSSTLDFALYGGPVVGLVSGTPPSAPSSGGSFLYFCM